MLSLSNTSNLYPPCLNKSRKNVSYRRIIRMQHERRKPLLLLTTEKLNYLKNLFLEGKRTGKNLLSERKLVEHPRRVKNIPFENVPNTLFIDSREKPVTGSLR